MIRAATLRLRAAPGIHPLDPYAPAFASTLPIEPGMRVLDMGCGAGLYALAAAARGARVVATDVDARAVARTLANAARNGLAARVEGRVGSLFEPVAGGQAAAARRGAPGSDGARGAGIGEPERFDVIVTSLPQLPAPRRVIATRWGGRDGLRLLRRVAARAGEHLAPGGRLYALVTDWADPLAVTALFAREGLRSRRVAHAERAFQPVEYERILPGLWGYLDARACAGRGRYRRRGSWCYLGVSFLEARPGRG